MNLEGTESIFNERKADKNFGGKIGVDENLEKTARKPVAFLKVQAWSTSSQNGPLTNDNLPTVYPIYNGITTIGRSIESDICFPFQVISMRHSMIEVKGKLHTIRDCKSTNETKLLGETLGQEVAYQLLDGNELMFGDMICSYFIGRLPDDNDWSSFVENEKRKNFKLTSAPVSHQSSALSSSASTVALTFLQNFIDRGDDDSDDSFNRNEENLQFDVVVSQSPVSAANRQNLPILVEESQLVSDGQVSSNSIFSNDKDVPTVVRETEQFFNDDEMTGTTMVGNVTKQSASSAIVGNNSNYLKVEENIKSAYGNQMTPSILLTNDGEEEEEINTTAKENGIQKDEEDAARKSINEEISIEEEIRRSNEAPMIPIRNEAQTDLALADTLPYVNALPIQLNSIRIENAFSIVSATPESLADGKTPSEHAGSIDQSKKKNRTSIWTVPTTDSGARTRKGQKKTSMDKPIDAGWLFGSEPDSRKKKPRAEGGNRRKTTGEKSKTTFDDLASKCKQMAIAGKRASNEKKKVLEGKREKSNASEGVPSTAAKDPFEFGPTQMVFDEMTDDSSSAESSTIQSGYKKTPKARKSIKIDKNNKSNKFTTLPSLVSTSTITAPACAPKRKLVNDEKLFDEAAEINRQQKPRNVKTVIKVLDIGQEVKKEPESQPLELNAIETRLEEEPPVKISKMEAAVNRNDAGSSKSKASVVVAPKNESNMDVDERDSDDDFLVMKKKEKPEKPKRKPKASPKKKAKETKNGTRSQERPQEPPVVPASQKSVTEKATRKRNKSQTTPVELKNQSIVKAPSPAKKVEKKKKAKAEEAVNQVKVCITQMSDWPKKKMDQFIKNIDALGGTVVDSAADCTHLVVPKFARSTKFMCAVACGKPIVLPIWMEASKKAGHFLGQDRLEEKQLMFLSELVEDFYQTGNTFNGTDEFLVKDESGEFNLQTCLSNARNEYENEQKRLFDGYKFYSTETVRPKKPEMKEIVISAGGKWTDRLPNTVSLNETLVVLASDQDSNTPDVEKAKALKAPIVTMEFVFTGLLKREVNIGKYKLFDVEETKGDDKVAAGTVTASQISSGGSKKGNRKK